jgi:non-heme chloroperoxidase
MLSFLKAARNSPGGNMNNTEASSSPIPDGIRFGTTTLRTGVTLAYAEQGEPRSETLLFVHGFADSWYSFSRILPLLSSAYHAYALDQRGHGNSDKPIGAYTQEVFAADIIAFMDAVGLSTVTLVGHSMGSFVAQRVVLRNPERVKRLVLMASAPTAVEHPALCILQQAILTLTDPVSRDFIYEAQTSGIIHPVPSDFLDTVVTETLKVPAPIMHAAITGLVTGDRDVDLASITVPTLIAAGDRDELFTEAEQRTLAEQIPHATLKIYEATGHGLHWEQPHEFVRDLETFLKFT